MTVTIKQECASKEVSIGTLSIGDTFFWQGWLFMHRGSGWRPGGSNFPPEFYIATRLTTGATERVPCHEKVEPVDIEITVVRK